MTIAYSRILKLTSRNCRQSYQRAVDQGGKIHGDELHEKFFRGVDGLDVRAVQKNHAWRPHEKSIQDASGVQH